MASKSTKPQTKLSLIAAVKSYYAEWSAKQAADARLKNLSDPLKSLIREANVDGVTVRDNTQHVDYRISLQMSVESTLVPERVEDCLKEVSDSEFRKFFLKAMKPDQLKKFLIETGMDKDVAEGVVVTCQKPGKETVKLVVHSKPHTFTANGALVEPKPTEAEKGLTLRKYTVNDNGESVIEEVKEEVTA